MSVSYWLIRGVGINANEVTDRLVNEKVVNLLAEQLPNDSSLQDMVKTGKYKNVIKDEEFLCEYGFDSMADFLTHCDDTDVLTYDDDGDGGSYLYYPPSMPWWLTPNDPKTLQETHERIEKAVQRVTDMTTEEIEKLINDDLYVVGAG